MTPQPFKFRHLDAIVGGFVIGAVALVAVAMLLVGHARQWFTRHATIAAETAPGSTSQEFTDDLSEMLRPGTPVELGGRNVGQVLNARQAPGQLLLELEVTSTALAQLHPDAKAEVKVPLAAFMGQPRVVLKAGSSGEPGWPTSGDWIPHLPIVPPRDPTVMARSLLVTMEGNLQPMLTRIAGVLDETQGLLKEVRAAKLPERTGQLLDAVQAQHLPERTAELMQRAERIAVLAEGLLAGLRDGKGAAGKLVADERLAGDLAALAADLRAITGELRQATPGLAAGAGSLIDQAQRLVDGLSRHWLLRSYTAPGEAQRLPPSGVMPPAEAKP